MELGSYADEFDHGLELILDGLEKRLGRSDGWGRGSTPVPQADRQAGTWLRQMRRTLNGTNSIKVLPIIAGHTLLEAALVS